MSDQATGWYERLTRAEREVLEAYAKLHSYRAVARSLGKSEGVVDRQLASARKKMGAISSAEAMFMLARRWECQTSKNDASLSLGKPIPNVAPGFALALSRLLRYIGGFALGMLATGVYWRSSGPGAAPKGPRSASEIAASVMALHRRPVKSPEQTAEIHARLVADLAARFWQDKWGPDEARDRQLLPAVSDDVLSAFAWACDHQPQTAVEIAGNGHRLFRLAQGVLGHEWPRMVRQASGLPTDRRTIAFGRLLCGTAFASVYKSDSRHSGRREGYLAAAESLQIFRGVGGCDSDVANALRHMGMCCVIERRSEAAQRYAAALSIYEGLHDEKGIAQTRLSIAQMNVANSSVAAFDDLGRNILAAISACRTAGGQESLGEAWDEMKVYKYLDGVRFRTILSGFRREMIAKCAFLAGEHQGLARLLTYEDCLLIDLRVGDDRAFAKDVEDAFDDIQGLSLNSRFSYLLVGFYDALCDRLHRKKSTSPTLAHRSGPDYETGRRLDRNAIVGVISNLAGS